MRVEIENIGVFRGKHVFELSEGVNIVYAPNASGKTSLVNALKLVLVPLPPREAARVLNDYESSGVVRISFGAKFFEITIKRTAKGVEVSGSTAVKNPAARLAVSADLENELVAAIFSGDADDVRRILHDATGVGYLKTVESILEAMIREAKLKRESEMRTYTARREEIERRVSEIEERLRKVEARISEILSDPSVKEAEGFGELKGRVDALTESLKNILSKKEAKKTEINAMRVELKKLENEKKTLEEYWERLKNEEEKLESMFTEAQERIRQIKVEFASLEELEKKINRKINELSETRRRRENLLEKPRCPCCGAPIDRNALEREIEELSNKIEELNVELDRVRDEINKLKMTENDIKTNVTYRKADIERELVATQRKIDELVNKVNALSGSIASAEEELRSLEARERELREEIRKYEKELEVLRGKSAAAEELRKLHGEKKVLTEALERERAALKQLDQIYDVARLEKEIEVLELLHRYFSLRRKRLETEVIIKINRDVEKHFKLLKLADLEFPILREDMSLNLVRRGGIKTNLSELSESEKAILSIILTLSLMNYLAPNSPVFIIDTLFEVIDDEKAKELLKYLEGINTTVVITKVKPGETKLLSQSDIIPLKNFTF